MKQTWKLTPEQRDQLVRDYVAGATVAQLLCKYNLCSGKSINTLLESRGVPRRKPDRFRRYQIREDFFDSLTEESAYLLGFLLADGYIAVRDGVPEGICVALAEIDRPHLERIRNLLCPDVPLKFKPARTSRPDWIESPQYTLNVYSQRLTQRILDWGISSPKPTAIVHKDLCSNRHFWRGVIDGDGSLFWSITSRSKPKPVLHLIGSPQPVQCFADYCRSVFPALKGTVKVGRVTNTFRLHCRAACRLAYELYSDCTITLQRKHALALEFISDTTQRHWQP